MGRCSGLQDRVVISGAKSLLKSAGKLGKSYDDIGSAVPSSVAKRFSLDVSKNGLARVSDRGFAGDVA